MQLVLFLMDHAHYKSLHEENLEIQKQRVTKGSFKAQDTVSKAIV